ncbi:hypothetical protein PHJA_001036900 [Phtheirospermum japonicum]|uniref:Uncharacterized protein n=1 Tax=Phtheirospermum japonicum TaxID=374723 RepID=A0A830BSD1_9LAMI|nr:hypothetical protein PHJA_001036900 [Phtheirospermum japonicum]
MDMKEKKLTVVGDVDPVEIVSKLRKFWHTEIVTVGPAKEPEKKKEDQEKKNEAKKDDNKKMYKNYHQYPYYPQHYHVYSAEENPNSCVIC